MKLKIGDLTNIRTGKLDANASSEDGQYPFFTCSKDPLKISTYTYDCECVLVAGNGDLNVKYYKGKFDAYQRTYIIEDNGSGRLYMPYLYYFMTRYVEQLRKQAIGGVIKYIKLGNLTNAEMELPTIEEQKIIVNIMEKAKHILDMKNQNIHNLNQLIQARFVELFGDLKSNNKRWPIVGFKECADIDTNMIHNFEGYEDYPHIGINCIEKETGRLIGYRTIAEDGVISGKYLFTPKHIIYSKIRPNLNKVALPDFKGLCSADAYPILVKSEICNREYFGYTLRSKYFLDYILAFSNRTNLPKVNKNQVEGFMLPLPSIDLQNQFAAFVQQVNKSKFVIHKFLYCTTHNTKSIIKPRPNTKESGKIRGGKPHADEF